MFYCFFSLNRKVIHVCRKAAKYTALTLSTGLSVGVFFLQFLDWWYASDTNAPSLMALPIPDPPKVNKVSLCLKIFKISI